MAIQDYKVSETYSGRDISSLPDKPNQAGMSATELKARFDQLSKEVIPQYNDLIDFISGALFGGVENTDHIHDTRYYTEAELDAGQLDDRYYTETEVNDLLATNSTNDRSRANHTGTQLASTISDFDSEVSNNTDVSNNTSARHTHANKTILDNTTASFTSADETKLDGIQSGAEVNQNAISNILVGGTSVSANAKTDTFEFIGGSNIQIIVNPTTKQITFNATGDISVSAENTTIVDLGGYFESGNVEGALQEIGLSLSNIGTGLLQASNNLSDVADVTTARDNLGLGTTDDVEFNDITANGNYYFTDGSYFYRDDSRNTWYFVDTDGTVLELGREQWFPENKASGAIGNGVPTQFAGAQGDHTLSKVAVPSEINANPRLFMGLSTKASADNDWTKIANFGVVHDVDTNGFAIGTILYFDSVNGGLTNVKPSAEYAQIEVGAVMVASTTVGAILVRVTFLQGANEVDIADADGYYTSTTVEGALKEVYEAKQDALVSGTNIKTINGESIVGGGDLEIGGSGQMLGNATVKAISYNAQTIAENITIPSTYNATSTGPITIQDGFTVTIEEGGIWVII